MPKMETRNNKKDARKIIPKSENLTSIIKNADTILASQIPLEPSPDPLPDE